MVSNADSIGTDVNAQTLAGFADRWIYVFMAALFVVAALTGFIPDSLRLLAAVESGQRPPLPPILHAHALVMGSWLMLFLVQTTLVATDRTAQHRRPGLVGAVLAVAVVLVTIGLVKTRWAQVLPPDILSRIETARSGILMEQIRELVLFSIFVVAPRSSQAPSTPPRPLRLAPSIATMCVVPTRYGATSCKSER